MALTDQTLQDAALALLNDLNANGCRPVFVQSVHDFQQSYVNSGGSLPNDSGGRSGIDGLYGDNTAAALQNTIDNNAATSEIAGQLAPAGCVGAAPGGGGGGGTVVRPGTSTNTTTSTASFFSAMSNPWIIGAAVVAGAALIYESAKHPIGQHARKASRGMHGHARKLLRRGRRRR